MERRILYTAESNIVYYYGDSELEAQTSLKSKYGTIQVCPEILEQGGVFKDPEFPHEDASVGDIDKMLDTANPQTAQLVAQWRQLGWNGGYTWYRVKDIAQKKYGAGYKTVYNSGDLGQLGGRMDIHQGMVGDCYFVSSVACVGMNKELIKMPLPSDNVDNDVGVYHFRFWYQGFWVDIVVDDYIPCYEVNELNIYLVGSNFSVNEDTKTIEFWSLMIEKAYAKLLGNYETIASGYGWIALEHLTGGYGETCSTKGQIPDNLFDQMCQRLQQSVLVCAGTQNGGRGIAGTHEYSVTGTHEINYNNAWTGQTEVVRLLRMRNPWGRTEWTGDWSDNSPLWQGVSDSVKAEIGFVEKDEGEFWISFQDALVYFDSFDACSYFHTSKVAGPGAKGDLLQKVSKWTSSQGSTQSPENMPMFTVKSNNSKGPNTMLIVSITIIRPKEDKANDAYIPRVYPTNGATTFDSTFFRRHQEILADEKSQLDYAVPYKSHSFGYTVPNGEYVVVAQRVVPGDETRFLIRILTLLE